MKAGFYPKLAFDGIRKNKRMYFPYVITCVVMVAVYYIILFLSDIRGATTKEFMILGGWVIAVFSVIFLFYTNSFLMRRRKKEFGLYNILGMGKRHISIILFWETLMIYAVAVLIGLPVGIALSKMAELALVHLMSEEVTFNFSISFNSLLQTAALYGAIFFLLLLNGLRQVRFSSAIGLLKSEAVGEKPPKANWVLGILGILFIAAGYTISLTIKNPLSAVAGFFFAVIFVVVGTYITFISGSVLFCKILQKNKNYYYKSNHFVSVSSMVYRMKRNGTGLASICILATMVLVTISSTVSLYAGAESSVRDRYPREINITFQYDSFNEESVKDIDSLTSEIEKVCEKYNIAPLNVIDNRVTSVTGQIQGNTVETDSGAVDSLSLLTYSNVVTFNIIPLDDYNRVMGTSYELSANEALLYSDKYEYNEKTISFKNGNTFTVKQQIDKMFSLEDGMSSVLPVVYLVVPDISCVSQGPNELVPDNGGNMFMCYRYYNFNTGLNGKNQLALRESLYEQITQSESYERHFFNSIGIENREEGKERFYTMYGSLLYLGVILSIVFLMAAVLIIYYKQISEGYEDQKRFEIMRKVGMTKGEIRKSINSQLLTVFFLPLIFAGLHLAFAFPVVNKVLILFELSNQPLFIITSSVCFVIFAFFYAVVYKITSNSYYRIVSDELKERRN